MFWHSVAILEKTAIRQGYKVTVRNQNWRYSASSLTDSLRSVVRLRRAVRPAGQKAINKIGGEPAGKAVRTKSQRPRGTRFSIGSAPLTSITEIS